MDNIQSKLRGRLNPKAKVLITINGINKETNKN